MTDGTVQGFRRTARESLTEALSLLQGEPGLKLREQESRIEDATDLVETALEALEEAVAVVSNRRADKKAAKKAAKASA